MLRSILNFNNKNTKSTKLVGCFTYSIPSNSQWIGPENLEIDHYSTRTYSFSNLVESLQYLRPEFLYGIEFQSPFKNDLGPVREKCNLDEIS